MELDFNSAEEELMNKHESLEQKAKEMKILIREIFDLMDKEEKNSFMLGDILLDALYEASPNDANAPKNAFLLLESWLDFHIHELSHNCFWDSFRPMRDLIHFCLEWQEKADILLYNQNICEYNMSENKMKNINAFSKEFYALWKKQMEADILICEKKMEEDEIDLEEAREEIKEHYDFLEKHFGKEEADKMRIIDLYD